MSTILSFKVFLFLLSAICSAQDGGVVKFLGIPLEGSKEQFAEDLVSKGFTYEPHSGCYKGLFNAKPVDVFVYTDHDVVGEVSVAFQDTTDYKVIEEYNQLIEQFRTDPCFMDFNMNEALLDNENISRGLSKGKAYEAHFSYYDPDRNPPLMEALLDKLSPFFTAEQLAKLKELAKKAADTPEDQKAALRVEMIEEMRKMGLGQDGDAKPDAAKVFLFMGSFMEGLKSLSDGDVWFKIQEFDNPARIQNRYRIVLYYDANK